MIDLHCHILPNVDDGAQSFDEAVLMAQQAVAQGITCILCTPHHQNGYFQNEKNSVAKKVQLFQQELTLRNIPLIVLPGQEIRINGELPTEIKEGKIQFLDTQNNYLLIEFPTTFVPSYADKLFFKLQENGHTPIIAHPERNRVFMKQPEKLKQFVANGALGQLTAASYLGYFGNKIQTASQQMISDHLVHIIASDAHNIENRGFCLKEAYDRLRQQYGIERMKEFQRRTKDILMGQRLRSSCRKSEKSRSFRKQR